MDYLNSYHISKHVVMEAFKRVKANKGAAGVDDESILVGAIRTRKSLKSTQNFISRELLTVKVRGKK